MMMARRRDLPLPTHQRRAQLGDAGVVRDGTIHARLSDLNRHVAFIGPDPAKTPRGIGHELHVRDERH
jgi:hypothetical protein